MKKVFIFIIMSLSVCLINAQNKSRYASSKDVENLQKTIDSLQGQIARISNENEKLYDAQTALANRMVEMREDYRNSLDNANAYIGWVIGLVTLIVAAFGVGVPLWSNHRTNKQSRKSMNKTVRLWNYINSIKTKVNNMQHKIETSERNARKSQEQAMISRLFAEAVKEEDIDNGIEIYSKILRLSSNDIQALINRSILYYNAGRYNEALKDASKIIDLAHDKPQGYAIRGMIYSCLHLYDQSIQDCTTAISIAPKDVRTYATRANAYLKFEKWEDAINDYDKILESTDLTAEQYNNRAYCYYKLGRLDIAMGDVEVSLNKMKHASAYDTRGCIYMAMGKDNYQMALDDFTKAISIAPNAWICYGNRANLYKRLSEDETDETKKAEYIGLYKNDLEIFRTKRLPEDKVEETEQTENEAE